MTSLFSSFTGYLSSLTSNVTKTFNGSNETGVDVGLPYHTPVYALVSGPVVGAGYYGGGGVVTIQSPISASNYNGLANVYTQHLSDISVQQGQYVTEGQLIGYSGGQIGYGDHPSTTQYSTGPHIEVGINAPYGGIWGSRIGPNVNPMPWINSLFGFAGQTGTAAAGSASSDVSGIGSAVAGGITAGLAGAGGAILQGFGASTLKDLAWRAGLVLLGIILLIVGFVALAGGPSTIVNEAQEAQGDERATAESAAKVAAVAA